MQKNERHRYIRQRIRLATKAIARRYISIRRSRWYYNLKLIIVTGLIVLLLWVWYSRSAAQSPPRIPTNRTPSPHTNLRKEAAAPKLVTSFTPLGNIDYDLDFLSLQVVHDNLKGSHQGCIPGLLNHHMEYAQQLLHDVPIVQRDVELLELGPTQQLIQYQRLEAYDYDEVKGVVAVFQNAFVAGVESIVFDCKVIYRPGGSAAANWNAFAPHIAGRLVDSTQHTVVQGKVVMIATYWGDRYYHWIIESMMRLSVVLDYLHKNPEVKILAYSPPKWNLRVIYQLLGLEESRFVNYRTEKLYHVENLIVPSAVAEGRANPRATNAMRSLLRIKVAEQYLDYSRRRKVCNNDVEADLSLLDYSNRLRILVQQRGSSNSTDRFMTNGHELVQLICDEYPHAIVERYDSNNSVERMMQLHYAADILIGPHGAGLSNAIFMNSGTHMLEIYMKEGMGPGDWVNPCHEITAKALGISYSRVRARWGRHKSPMVVDIPQAMEALRDIVANYSKSKQSEALGPVRVHRITHIP